MRHCHNTVRARTGLRAHACTHTRTHPRRRRATMADDDGGRRRQAKKRSQTPRALDPGRLGLVFLFVHIGFTAEIGPSRNPEFGNMAP